MTGHRIDIHAQRGNAIKLLVRVLRDVQIPTAEVNLVYTQRLRGAKVVADLAELAGAELAEAERAIGMGAHLSISGIVTFPSAGELREAVASAPLDRLMVETDSPYLAPTPHRGRRNRPALVARVGEEVAALQGRPVEQVAGATTATAVAFYSLDERRSPDG